jgi:hypothetical protein
MNAEPRTCARRGCGASLEGRRVDARYCGSYCRFTAWIERHPEAREKRLAMARSLHSGRSTRKARKGAHGERGVRIYFAPDDLHELRDVIGALQHASPRLTRKVDDASERIERG